MIDSTPPTIADPADARIASIVAFLNAEAARFDSAARGISSEATHSAEVGERHSRLVVRASMCRTLAAQIARGDDLRGGE